MVILLIHGILHLLGYDHERSQRRQRQATLEITCERAIKHLVERLSKSIGFNALTWFVSGVIYIHGQDHIFRL